MAETKVGSAFVDLKVKDDKFNQDMNKAGGRLKKLGAGMARFGKAAGVVAAGLAVVAGASIRALSKQEEAEAKLEQVIRATGGAAGFTAEQLKKEASELQKLTKFGDEAIIESQALLATFREIKGENFKEATSLVLDMATLFGDARSATIQLGKALNDPIRGVTALTRVGVTFTDQQKQQIRNYQEMGDVTKAQKVILEELQNQFGGVAAAAADTIGGRFEQLKNSLGDTLEEIGGLIAGTDGGFADVLLKMRIAVDEFNEGLKRLGETVNPVTEGIKKFFAAFKRGGNLISGFSMNMAEGKGFIESFKQAGAAADIIESRRKAAFSEAKAASEMAKGKLATAQMSPSEVPGATSQAQKRAKQGFQSFTGAIKNTQNAQQKKDNMKIIKNGQDQLNVQNKMLAELEEMNDPQGTQTPIVTE
ncbi:phage tail length tape measure family protein [Candidatus Pacearchaeota archaeon]|nr:phage tail length tape measure family protein [Candidatus Pacearchaeota archaeon]